MVIPISGVSLVVIAKPLSQRDARLQPQLTEALETQSETAPGVWFDLAGFGAEEVLLVSEVLGEGEVAATVALPNGVIAQIQEGIMAGLWQVRFTDADDRLVADYVEVAWVPEAARRSVAMTLGGPAVESWMPRLAAERIAEHLRGLISINAGEQRTPQSDAGSSPTRRR